MSSKLAFTRNGYQFRRHLWKNGWDLGCGYPGKSSYLCRALGLVMAWRIVVTARGYGWNWGLGVLMWQCWYWMDWDGYAPLAARTSARKEAQ